MARKFKFRQVKVAAAAALDTAAQELGISVEELADRIVPDLGFSEDGTRVFHYGKRSFTVRLTPALELAITTDAGKPVKNADGSLVETVNWKLVPEPCADVYKIAPFAVTASPKLLSTAADEGSLSFVAGHVYFEAPPARETVTGDMEADPQKDLPPLSWKLVGWCALALFAVAAVVAAAWFLLRYLARRIKEHRMSPIERAWVELDRLLKKGLPGRGRYKDFYVELTMVVRRYVQRKYGIRAPHMTTEEFFEEIGSRGMRSEELRRFLESADLVKFAGVQATPEMADDATESARGYLKTEVAQ
jgi:hypothetical protein